MSRSVGSFLLVNNDDGCVYPGYEIEYNFLLRQDGHVWIEYQQNEKTWWLPYNTWDSVTGAVGKEEWVHLAKATNANVPTYLNVHAKKAARS